MGDEMDRRVLVAYATEHGGTAEIAERIGEVLREAGFRADVLPAGRDVDPAAYDAIVLGSGVYIGRWRHEAARFLKANEQALADLPIWLFSSGPTGDGDPTTLAGGWRLPGALRPIVERVEPRDVALFHGVLDGKRLNIIERWMIKNVKAPLGDYRDWEAITAWATAVAQALQESSTTSD
jgi:menaquinone-dependent protoporphyrinogen oxidase